MSAGRLGVHEQRHARGARGSASPRAGRSSSTAGNSSTPDGTRKHLKPRTPASTSSSSSRGVARHDAAPERDVDVTLAARRRPLRLERRRGRRRGHAVERHVDDRRDAAGRGRARRGIEPFPVGAARLVDVDVRVDDARRDDEIAGVDVCSVRRSSSCAPTRAILPSWMWIEAGRTPSGRTTRRLRLSPWHQPHRMRSACVSRASGATDLRVARFRNDPPPARPTNLPSSMTSRPRDSTVSVAPVTWRPSYGL